MAKRTPAPRDTKERILDAALDVFGARGYATASVDEIAARAGVTKGAVYYWFEDKEDLARDLHTSIYQRLQDQAVRAMDPAAGALENLKRAFDAYLAALEDLGSARFFLRDIFVVPNLDDGSTGQINDATALVQAIIETGKGAGEIVEVDAEATARVLIGAFSGATMHILRTGSALPTRMLIDRLIGALAAQPEDAPLRPVRGATRKKASAR